MTLGLFLLRTSQLGLSMTDLDSLEYGTIIDMMTEAANDGCEYREIASQDDFDRF
jgi:hypothetical protein